MIPPTIHLSHIDLAYDKRVLFHDLTLTLAPGKWVGLLGASGVGKSTLLRLIAGLTQPLEVFTGAVYADNKIPLQQQVSYMAQTDLLLPWLSVLDNTIIGYTLRNRGISKSRAIQKQANVLLKAVGLDEALHLYPHQLSGGMRQRVALVRTLIENKPVILMDEPFSALDAITRYKLQNLTAKLLQGRTVLFVTHDPAEALRLSDDIYLLQGRPAQTKKITTLTTSTPRELASPELALLEAGLFQELANASEDN